MATHSGHEGIAKVGTDTVLEVTAFTLDRSAETIDDTELSDASKSFIAGQKGWTASIEAHFDEADTTGQAVLVEGATVTVNLFFGGDTTGETQFGGTGIVNSLSINNGIASTVTASFGLQGSGDLATTVVPA